MTPLQAALAYAEQGWYVFPIYEPEGDSCACGDAKCNHPAKHPRTPNGHLDATIDPVRVRAWWRRWSRANVGIACGPSGLVVTDIDPRHNGDASFEALRAELGATAFDTLTHQTGGGGAHYLFRASRELVEMIGSHTNALGPDFPGIDVKAGGGYVLAPPSQHISGALYTKELSSPDEPAELPQRLAAMLLGSQERKPIAGVDDGAPIPQGERNATLTRYAGRLQREGTGTRAIRYALRAVNQERCKPPMPEREVDGIAKSVGRYKPAPHGVLSNASGVASEPNDESEERKSRAWPLRSAADITLDNIAPVEMDVDDLIERDSGPVMIFGMPESLKSWIALHVSRCMVTREPVFGHFAVTRRRESVFLNFDAPAKAFERRVALTRSGMGGDGATKLLFASPETYEAEQLKETMEEHAGAFVSLDCLADVYRPDPRTERGEAMRAWLRDLRKLYEKFGSNGIIVDHSRRPKPGDPSETERYYGSVQKKAALRQMWFVERLRQADGDPSVIRAKIVCEKLSEAEKFKTFVIEARWSPDSVTLSYVGPLSAEVARADAAARHREIIEPYLRDNRDGLTTSQLVTMTHLSKKQVLAAVKTPGIAGTGKGKNQRWVLCEASDDDESGDEAFLRSQTLADGNEGTNRRASSLRVEPLAGARAENVDQTQTRASHGRDSFPNDGNESGNEWAAQAVALHESAEVTRDW